MDDRIRLAAFEWLDKQTIIKFVHLLMPKMTPMDDNLNYIKK
jgi:hypothetical protein